MFLFEPHPLNPRIYKLLSSSATFLLVFVLTACNQFTVKAEPDVGVERDELSDIENLEQLHDEFALPEIEDTTIWPRVRNGFELETGIEYASVRAEMEWYKKNTGYMNRVMKRSEPFLHFILNEIDEHDLPTELVLLPIVESAFQPFAYSHGRAAGIWQFIPSTGRLYGLKQNWWYDGRRDVYASTEAAIRYLKNLNKIFDGDWLHALAAYNSGPGTVQKAIRKNKRNGKPTDFWHLKLPRETRAYVPKLLALKEIVQHPKEHGISLRCIQDLPGFEVVDIGSQIDLALAAELAELPVDKLYRYNAAFNRWATSPDGPHRLLLPVDHADVFRDNLSALGDDERLSWKRHKIREGETLSHIAVRYGTTVKHLRKVNKLRGNNIRAGKHLLIPIASRNQSHYALSATQRKKSIQNTQRGDDKIEHIVSEGESFWVIARRYGVSMHSLAKWNGMAVRDHLKTGQKLVVWTRSSSESTEIASFTTKPSDTVRAISYTVRNGDSLSRIASRYRVSVSDLHRWNKIEGKYLQPGQRLKVFVDITDQSGGSG